ncbi:MAG: hypothetical protein RSD68_05595 [Oscillospiraceae bacterium]
MAEMKIYSRASPRPGDIERKTKMQNAARHTERSQSAVIITDFARRRRAFKRS